jgi:hypothetical protein
MVVVYYAVHGPFFHVKKVEESIIDFVRPNFLTDRPVSESETNFVRPKKL